MIKFSEVVPSVYTSASRDFQYVGRLIDIVLNSVKHNVDSMYNLPNIKTDTELAELLAMTLGFKVKRNYDKAQLSAIVSVIPLILKYKGSLEAVDLAGKALLLATGSSGLFKCAVVNNCLEITLPKAMVDTTLFTDLLPYILPAGLTYRIARQPYAEDTLQPTEVSYGDMLQVDTMPVLTWDNSKQTSTGLATMFDVGGDANSTTANFIYDAEGTPTAVNVGLLSNSIIPDFVEPLKIESAKNAPVQKDEDN